MASLKAFMASLNGHAARTDNPHAVTYAQTGAIQDAANTVTDTHIGNRTITDNAAPTTDTGNLIACLSWLANRLQAITGQSSWRYAPAINLATTATQIQAITGQPNPTLGPPVNLSDCAFHLSAEFPHAITGFGTTVAALSSSSYAGVSTAVSRADHVHPYPSAANVGAMATSHPASAITGFAGGGSATTVSRSDHGHSGYALTAGSTSQNFSVADLYVGSSPALVGYSAGPALQLTSTNLYLTTPSGGVARVSDVARAAYKAIEASAFTVNSSRDVKKEIVSMTGATAKVRDLQAVRYRYQQDDARQHAGFIAEEVAAVFPEAVFASGEDLDGMPASVGIDYGKLAVLALQACKELDARLTAIEGGKA